MSFNHFLGTLLNVGIIMENYEIEPLPCRARDLAGEAEIKQVNKYAKNGLK